MADAGIGIADTLWFIAPSVCEEYVVSVPVLDWQ